jgi:hypothetical protein
MCYLVIKICASKRAQACKQEHKHASKRMVPAMREMRPVRGSRAQPAGAGGHGTTTGTEGNREEEEEEEEEEEDEEAEEEDVGEAAATKECEAAATKGDREEEDEVEAAEGAGADLFDTKFAPSFCGARAHPDQPRNKYSKSSAIEDDC